MNKKLGDGELLSFPFHLLSHHSPAFLLAPAVKGCVTFMDFVNTKGEQSFPRSFLCSFDKALIIQTPVLCLKYFKKYCSFQMRTQAFAEPNMGDSRVDMDFMPQRSVASEMLSQSMWKPHQGFGNSQSRHTRISN